MDVGFSEGTAIIGLLLVGAAVASGLGERSILSIAVLSLAAGLILAWIGVVTVAPGAQALVVLVELVLLLTLFSDGLIAEGELIREHWHPAARALVIAMPLNAVALGLIAHVLFSDLSWPEAFLLGFALSPTDPVVTSSVVASPRVPRLVRHTLNLESGLNDGLALPFVLFFLTFADTSRGSVVGSIGDLAVETILGIVLGGALAYAAGQLLDRLPDWALTERYEALFALGLGLACFGVTDLLHGNGLVGAFVGGVAFTIARRDVPEVFLRFNENVSAVMQVIIFAVFGALIIATGSTGETAALLAFIALSIFVVRPLSVLIAFIGVEMRRPEKLFIAWFGPKGVASMLFALLILNSTAPDRTLVFEIASFTVLASILAHGLTDTVGAGWIERRLRGDEAGEEP